MRIAIIGSSVHPAKPGYYGGEQQNTFLAQALLRLGHEVLFVAPPGSEPVGEMLYIPSSNGTFNRMIEAEGYRLWRDKLLKCDYILDISSFHFVTESFYYWERPKWTGTLVWIRTGSIVVDPRPPASRIMHGVLLSNAHREYALRHSPQGFLNPDRLHTIAPGIDTTLFAPSPDSERTYFLYLARPHPQKGIMKFIQIAQQRPSQQFVMAFSMTPGTDHETYGRAAIEASRGVTNLKWVDIGNSIDKKLAMFRSAKALVTPQDPSYLDCWPATHAEALACGTPVISAAQGGHVEMVTPHSGALCTSEADYLAAIDNVDSFDNDECRRIVTGNFSNLHWAQRLIQLEREIRSSSASPQFETPGRR